VDCSAWSVNGQIDHILTSATHIADRNLTPVLVTVYLMQAFVILTYTEERRARIAGVKAGFRLITDVDNTGRYRDDEWGLRNASRRQKMTH